MNSKERYTQARIVYEEAKEAQSKADKLIKETVTDKLRSLQNVAISTAQKLHGNSQIGPESFGFSMEWLSERFDVVRLEENAIVISGKAKTFERADYYGNRKVQYKDQEIKLSLSYLSMSDRDMASKIRLSVKAFKQLEKEKELRESLKKESEVQKEIEKLEKDCRTKATTQRPPHTARTGVRKISPTVNEKTTSSTISN